MWINSLNPWRKRGGIGLFRLIRYANWVKRVCLAIFTRAWCMAPANNGLALPEKREPRAVRPRANPWISLQGRRVRFHWPGLKTKNARPEKPASHKRQKSIYVVKVVRFIATIFKQPVDDYPPVSAATKAAISLLLNSPSQFISSTKSTSTLGNIAA